MARLAMLVLVLTLGTALWTAIRPVWAIDPDAGLYLGLGRSIAAGEGYALDGVPHTKYPPAFPLLLAGLVGVGGQDAYGLFHGALVICVLASVVLAYAVGRTLGVPAAAALALSAATGLSQSLYELSVHYLRTEPMFLALSLGALLALWRSQRTDAGWSSTLAACLLVAAATLTRLAGVSLAVVPALALLRRDLPLRVRLRAVLPLATGLVVVLAWQLHAANVARHDVRAVDYGAEFWAAEPRDLTKTVRLDMPGLDGASLARRVAGNLDVMARAMPVLLANVDRAGSRLPVGIAALLLVAAGLVTLCRSREACGAVRRQAALYVVATLALYLIWPFNQQERFYLPLLPLLLLAAGSGLVVLLELARRTWDRPIWRRTLLVTGAALIGVLAMQRSDHPVLLGRWSASYAAMLAVAGLGWGVAWRARQLPQASPAMALLVAAAVAIPFGHKRFVEWPAIVRAFQERRESHPLDGPLARIDVDPRLERVALFLNEQPPATVLMTDVPSILWTISGRHCIPFVYRANPPGIETRGADLVFYTRELADASAAVDAAAPSLVPALQLPPVAIDGQLVTPTVYRTGR